MLAREMSCLDGLSPRCLCAASECPDSVAPVYRRNAIEDQGRGTGHSRRLLCHFEQRSSVIPNSFHRLLEPSAKSVVNMMLNG